MNSENILLTNLELIFMSKVLDHHRLYILQFFNSEPPKDHNSAKNKILNAIYQQKNCYLEFTLRELAYLRKVLFQYFLSSLKNELIIQDSAYLEVYFKVIKALKEEPNEVLLKLKNNNA